MVNGKSSPLSEHGLTACPRQDHHIPRKLVSRIIFLVVILVCLTLVTDGTAADFPARVSLRALAKSGSDNPFIRSVCEDNVVQLRADLADRLYQIHQALRPPNTCIELGPLVSSTNINSSVSINRFCETQPTEMQQYCCVTAARVCDGPIELPNFLPNRRTDIPVLIPEDAGGESLKLNDINTSELYATSDTVERESTVLRRRLRNSVVDVMPTNARDTMVPPEETETKKPMRQDEVNLFYFFKKDLASLQYSYRRLEERTELQSLPAVEGAHLIHNSPDDCRPLSESTKNRIWTAQFFSSNQSVPATQFLSPQTTCCLQKYFFYNGSNTQITLSQWNLLQRNIRAVKETDNVPFVVCFTHDILSRSLPPVSDAATAFTAGNRIVLSPVAESSFPDLTKSKLDFPLISHDGIQLNVEDDALVAPPFVLLSIAFSESSSAVDAPGTALVSQLVPTDLMTELVLEPLKGVDHQFSYAVSSKTAILPRDWYNPSNLVAPQSQTVRVLGTDDDSVPSSILEGRVSHYKETNSIPDLSYPLDGSNGFHECVEDTPEQFVKSLNFTFSDISCAELITRLGCFPRHPVLPSFSTLVDGCAATWWSRCGHPSNIDVLNSMYPESSNAILQCRKEAVTQDDARRPGCLLLLCSVLLSMELTIGSSLGLN